MIGFYTQNKNTCDQFIAILSDLSVIAYQPNNQYQALIWLSDKAPPKDTPVLNIPFNELPWTRTQWRLFVQKYLIETSRYENSSFIFDPSQRLLTDLISNKSVALTEKETAFLAFLVQAKNHTATRDEILEHVWQYSPEAETHTVESHLYALKQKIGTHADKLINAQEGIFRLI